MKVSAGAPEDELANVSHADVIMFL
jgi:hypothetical protein